MGSNGSQRALPARSHFIRPTSARPPLWWSALTFGIPALYALILLWFHGRVGVSDYDQFLVFDELQYWHANLFGMAKQWTPLLCGGLSAAGEPQIPFASLTMLLSYALGPLPGIVTATGVYLTLGWIGSYLYGGLWLNEPRQRALAASLYIGNGFFICRIAHGHIDFMPFLILPIALWILHVRCGGGSAETTGPKRSLSVLLLGGLVSLAIDGSPVSIIHLLVWIGLYACVLSWVRRSAAPLICFLSACAIASVLDAGYLWPMVSAQQEFPRRTADTFTGPWSLIWFLLVPHRGKVLPSNGTGIELSVFIGPFIALLIWRFRDQLRQIPADVRVPLMVVSLVCIWLGMGSLHAAGLPVWISPFDWLRPLPGFRSMGATGRYWGFLALPLSQAGAFALSSYANQAAPGRGRTALLIAVVFTQLIFEAQSVSSAWSHSRVYTPAPLQALYRGVPQQVERVYLPTTRRRHHRVLQGELISPTRAVINCYDMDDFKRAPVTTGSELLQDLQIFSPDNPSPPLIRADFLSWDRIQVAPLPGAEPVDPAALKGTARLTFNQAFHRNWTSDICHISEGPRGNLTAECPTSTLTRPVELTFFDPVSALGARVSAIAWAACAIGVLLLVMLHQLYPRPGLAPSTPDWQSETPPLRPEFHSRSQPGSTRPAIPPE